MDTKIVAFLLIATLAVVLANPKPEPNPIKSGGSYGPRYHYVNIGYRKPYRTYYYQSYPTYYYRSYGGGGGGGGGYGGNYGSGYYGGGNYGGGYGCGGCKSIGVGCGGCGGYRR